MFRLAATAAALLTALPLMADPLPSWNDTGAKARIIEFVDSVTDPASVDYVTPADRIAVFGNDGTLWAEQPMYFQFLYALDVFQRQARANPALVTSDALRAAASGDIESLIAGGEPALLEVVNATHSGLSVAEFQTEVALWLDEAEHPQTGLRYDQMTYQPMGELLRYLRDEGFETFIVSGGGIHFMRAFAEKAYGIPPPRT